MIKKVISFLLLSFVTSTIICQEINYAVLNRKNIIGTDGYSRITNCFNNRLILTTDPILTIVVPEWVINVWGLSVGEDLLIAKKSKWKIINRVSIMFANYNNNDFTSMSFSGRVAGIGGYYTSKFIAAIKAESILPITSNVKFKSDEYRALYGNPSDGWQNPSSVYFKYGIQFGYTIKERSDIIAWIGNTTKIKNFNYYIVSNPSFTLSINYHFGKIINNSTE